MAGKNSSFILIVVCLIVVMAGGLWAADTTGLIDVNAIIFTVKEQVVKRVEKKVECGDSVSTPLSPLEIENQKLLSTITLLETEIVTLQKEKSALLLNADKTEKELEELRAFKNEQIQASLNAKQLAAYYKEMKATAIVKIMNNLDDETIILILPYLEQNQIGEILSLMEPERAALITHLLLGQGE